MLVLCWSVFFFKQKTAYEMRISDWSSDVCSSDLPGGIDVRLKVSIGAVPDTVTGTVLSQATLANLSGADDLLIRGIQSIDLYGDFALGGRNAQGAATQLGRA